MFEPGVEGVFLAGMGVDFAGALLLAKGLLLSPRLLRLLSGSFWSLNPHELRERTRNRIDAQFGIGYLALGAAIQFLGHPLVLGGVETKDFGGGQVASGLLVGVTSGVASGVLYLSLRTWRYRSLAVEMAHHDSDGTRRPRPSGALLLTFGGDAWPPLEGESQHDYAKRVWKVDDIHEGAFERDR